MVSAKRWASRAYTSWWTTTRAFRATRLPAALLGGWRRLRSKDGIHLHGRLVLGAIVAVRRRRSIALGTRLRSSRHHTPPSPDEPQAHDEREHDHRHRHEQLRTGERVGLGVVGAPQPFEQVGPEVELVVEEPRPPHR